MQMHIVLPATTARMRPGSAEPEYSAASTAGKLVG